MKCTHNLSEDSVLLLRLVFAMGSKITLNTSSVQISLLQLFLFFCSLADNKTFYLSFSLFSFSGLTNTHSRYNYVVYFVFPVFTISSLFLLLSCFLTKILLRTTFSLVEYFSELIRFDF